MKILANGVAVNPTYVAFLNKPQIWAEKRKVQKTVEVNVGLIGVYHKVTIDSCERPSKTKSTKKFTWVKI